MGKIMDLTSNRYGRLVVLSGGVRTSNNKVAWICRCDCGNMKKVSGENLKTGHVKSCGCLKSDLLSIRNKLMSTTHGESNGKSSEYYSWVSMRKRCLNPKHKSYKDYGGRGIAICERWNSYDNFIFDMGRKPTKSHSIERIDNNKGYSPENCKWGTKEEQSNNQRSNRILEWNGQSMTLSKWAKKRKMSTAILSYRLKRGWSIHDALFRPVRR